MATASPSLPAQLRGASPALLYNASAPNALGQLPWAAISFVVPMSGTQRLTISLGSAGGGAIGGAVSGSAASQLLPLAGHGPGRFDGAAPGGRKHRHRSRGQGPEAVRRALVGADAAFLIGGPPGAVPRRGQLDLAAQGRLPVAGQRYGAAEKRELQQLVFTEEKAAAEAFAKVKAGSSLADVAKEMRANVLVIDHHVSEDDISDRWFKDTSAEATARIVYEIGLRLKVPLTERIATPLYAGLSTDTGGFRFPSTSGESFRVAARLVDAGASPPPIYRELFEQDSIARLHLVGRTLAGAEVSHEGRVILSTVRQSDIKEVHALPADTEDLVNLTLAVKGTEVGVILIEQPDGRIKTSFRSRCHVDCNALAKTFGGGGHKAAAGAILPGPFDAAREQVVAAVDAAVRHA
jgi:nanoRNase/pAp phosphatase (c-di-AMP/oligoRNAs hydrolase)